MNRKRDATGNRPRSPGPNGKRATVQRQVSDITDRTDKDLTGLELLALAEATGRLQPDPFRPLESASGTGTKPDPNPNNIAAALARVLADFQPDPVLLIHEARHIYFAMLHAQDREARCENSATAEQTTRELNAVAEACEQLERALSQLRRPAADLIDAQLQKRPAPDESRLCHGRIWHLIGLLHLSAAQGVTDIENGRAMGRRWFGRQEPIDFLDRPKGGRPRKHVASDVCFRTAVTYWRITKQRPTYTTNPLSHQTSSIWLDVLRSVFETLHIVASPEAQARILSKSTKNLDYSEISSSEWLDYY